MANPLYDPFTTLLRITGRGVSPYSARGLTQTLAPVDPTKQGKRCINGQMVDFSAPQFKKYKSVITCTDQNAPAFDGLMPGDIIEVDCAATLSYKTGGTPQRTPVDGSSRTDGDYTIYHPHMTFMVMDFNTSEDEWGATIGWELDLEEV